MITTTATIGRYRLRSNRSTIHIDGLNEVTKPRGGEDKGYHEYALSPCSALSSNRYLDYGDHGDDVAEILETARLNARVYNLKVCKNCEKAALRTIAENEADADAAKNDADEVHPDAE